MQVLAILTLWSLLSITLPVNAQGVALTTSLCPEGPTGPFLYSTLKEAFDNINAGVHQCAIKISIIGNTTETATAVLDAGNYYEITICPEGGEPRYIDGFLHDEVLVELNGSNVTIDGLDVNGNSLIISNTSTSGASGTGTIGVSGDAINVSILRTTVLGSSTTASGVPGGNLLIGDGVITGIDNLNVSECKFGPVGTNLPSKLIHLGGSSNAHPGAGNSGTQILNSEFFGFGHPATSSSAIEILSGTVNAIIQGCLFYQPYPIFQSSSNLEHTVVKIDNPEGVNYTISGCTVGNADNMGNGNTEINLSSGGKFEVFDFTMNTAIPVVFLEGNTLEHIAITGSSFGTGASAPVKLINIEQGQIAINNNDIGSQTETDNITFTTSSTVPTEVVVINKSGAGNSTFSNNRVGGITGSGSGSTSIFALRVTDTSPQPATSEISGNTFGGSVPHSIQSTTTGSATKVHAVNAFNVNVTVTDNDFRNLTAAGGTGTLTNASICGVCVNAPNFNITVEDTKIYNLHNSHPTAGTTVTGLHLLGSGAVEQNLCYGLTSNSTSTAGGIYGFRLGGAGWTINNNAASVGTGNEFAIPLRVMDDISGINHYDHNTFYMGGSATAGTGNSYVFYINQQNIERAIINSIFLNKRSMTGSATGESYVLRMNSDDPDFTGSSIQDNILYNEGAGTNFGFIDGEDQTFTTWETNHPAIGTINGDPEFALAEGSPPVLSPAMGIPTPVEATGLPTSTDTDINDLIRSTLTPVDRGAYAGNFTPLAPMQVLSTTTTQPGDPDLGTNSVDQIIAIIQINTLGVANPITVTGLDLNLNGTDDLSDLTYIRAYLTIENQPFGTHHFFGGVDAPAEYEFTLPGDIQLSEGLNKLFVVAGISCGADPGNNVDVGCNAIHAGNIYNPTVQNPPEVFEIVDGALSGPKTIGTDGDYETLGEACEDVNRYGLSGPVTMEILNDLTLTETCTLREIRYCNGGPHTLTLTTSEGETPVVEGNSDEFLFVFKGAKYCTIDGSDDGSDALTWRNIGIGGVFSCMDGAQDILFEDLIVESQNPSTLSGSLLLGTSNNGEGNSDITIRSSKLGGSSANSICQNGTPGAENHTVSIEDCEFDGFTNAAVDCKSSGMGNNWNINPSSFYQSGLCITPITAISIQGGSGHTILNNSIGGSAPNAGGTYLNTSSTFRGIDLNVGTDQPTSVQGNVIKNIRSTLAGSYVSSYGIYLRGGKANIGNIEGNVIGSSDPEQRYEISGDNYGIRVTSTSSVNLSNNMIDNFTTAPGSPTAQFFRGINVEGAGGTHTVVNNTIKNVSNGSTPNATNDTQTIGLFVTSAGVHTIKGNTIHNVGCTNATVPTSRNNRIWGMIISGTAPGTIVDGNKVYNIFGSSTAFGARADVITLFQSQSAASATFSNNMISGSDLSGTSDRTIFGMIDLSAAPAVSNYFHNTVNIYGTATNANPSYAFRRTGTIALTLKNNIFNNSRTGGTGFHVAIANTNASATGWPSTASDYNDLNNVTSAHLAQWLGTASGNNRNLAGWQVAQGSVPPGSGGDANSQNVLPVFTSPTDLHLTVANTQLENMGTPVPLVVEDFDGDGRNFITPDIGADEFTTGCVTIVTNTNDNGTGSIRDIYSCAFAGETITFSPGIIDQTIILTGGEILIDKSIRFNGLGTNALALSGNNASRLFNIASSKILILENMTLTDGTSLTNGGAFWNQGNVILKAMKIENCDENGFPKAYTGGPGSLLEVFGNTFLND